MKQEEANQLEILNPKVNRMLIVDLGHKKIGIQFRHVATQTLVRGEKLHTRMTHCGIFGIPEKEGEEAPKLTYGVAKCSKSDQFSKEKGRKCALTRALLQGVHEFSGVTPETKEIRTKIWNAYRNRGASQSPSNGNDNGAVINAEVVRKELPPAVEVPVVIH